MDIDPLSISAGFGAGEQAGFQKGNSIAQRERTRAEIAENEAESNANIALKSQEGTANAVLALAVAVTKVKQQEKEITNRWIPYGVRLKASIVAGRVEKQTLIDELKRLDPANAENIVKQARQDAITEYDRLTTTGSELAEINRMVREESEAGRLDQ